LEQIERKNLIFRRISYLDFGEFKKAAIESISTNEAYLAYGHIFRNISVIDYMTYFSGLLKNQGREAFGLFHRSTILGFVTFEFGMSKKGCELIGWARNGYHNLGLGELALNTACEVAFQSKGFNYVELRINETNEPSRRVAEKAGFRPYLKFRYEAGEEQVYIYYLKINPAIDNLAKRYRKRVIDIINSPASQAPYHHFLKAPSVSQFYEWPFGDFRDDIKPVNYNLLSSYLAIINLEPDDLGVDPNTTQNY